MIESIEKGLVVDGEGGLLVGATPDPQWEALGRRLRHIADAAAEAMPEVTDQLSQVSIALRLWAGCIDAAKAIAYETRSGPNTPGTRARAFEALIDPLAINDALYCAGIEAAPVFKKRRGDPYSLDGVPDASPVRRYVGETPRNGSAARP